MIPRRLLTPKRLRPNDIPYKIPREQNRRSQLLLRVTRYITTDNRQTHAKPEALEVAEPQCDQAAPFVSGGEADEQTGTDDADRVGDDHG